MTASTFEAGIMSGLRRLFQMARERNSLTWMEMYWQGGLYALQSGRGLQTVVKAKSCFFFATFIDFIAFAVQYEFLDPNFWTREDLYSASPMF